VSGENHEAAQNSSGGFCFTGTTDKGRILVFPNVICSLKVLVGFLLGAARHSGAQSKIFILQMSFFS
jgi:hypothetical protein